MRTTLLAVAALTGVYLLALASLQPADVLTGVVVAAGALAVARRAPAGPTGPGLRSLPWLVPFAAAVLVDVVKGTWEVALVVVGLRPVRGPGVVEVPAEGRTETGAVASAIASTLSPGEVLIDIDTERRCALLHVLDARDEEAVRAAHRRGYARHQRKALP